jgi:hypothetical protein
MPLSLTSIKDTPQYYDLNNYCSLNLPFTLRTKRVVHYHHTAVSINKVLTALDVLILLLVLLGTIHDLQSLIIIINVN